MAAVTRPGSGHHDLPGRTVRRGKRAIRAQAQGLWQSARSAARTAGCGGHARHRLGTGARWACRPLSPPGRRGPSGSNFASYARRQPLAQTSPAPLGTSSSRLPLAIRSSADRDYRGQRRARQDARHMDLGCRQSVKGSCANRNRCHHGITHVIPEPVTPAQAWHSQCIGCVHEFGTSGLSLFPAFTMRSQ